MLTIFFKLNSYILENGASRVQITNIDEVLPKLWSDYDKTTFNQKNSTFLTKSSIL